MNCPYCAAAVDDLATHYAHNPPTGCRAVAVALDPVYFPYALADAATEQRRAAGQANGRQVRRRKPTGGAREPLPVVGGVKFCRCLRGPARKRGHATATGGSGARL